MEYTVVNILNIRHKIKANSLNEVVDSVEHDDPPLCTQCAYDLSIGNTDDFIILDDHDNEVYNSTPIDLLEKKLELSTALNTRYYLKLDNALKTLEGIILKTQNNGGVFDLADLAVMVDSLDGDLDG